MLLPCLVLAVWWFTPFAGGADWYVDLNHAGCAGGSGGMLDPFCSIATAIAAASPGDTLHIAAGTYVENLDLDKDLDLIGTSGAAVTLVDGGASGRVIKVVAGVTASLDGLTITNGNAANGAGLIVNDSAHLTLSNATVSGNSATDRGGGMYVRNATVYFHCSTVSYNCSYYAGAGLYITDGSLSITESSVDHNHALSGGAQSPGGGLSIANGCVMLTNTYVTDNQAGSTMGGVSQSRGGGIYCADGTLHLDNVTLQNNFSESDGGGLAILASQGRTPDVTVVNSLFDSNISASLGGGIFIEANSFGAGVGMATLDVTNSMIQFNEARTRGGGIANEAVASGSGTTLTLANTTISDNCCPLGSGGGISSFVYNTNTTITMTNSTLQGNSASGTGGGLIASIDGKYTHAQNISMTDCTVSDNDANHGGGLSVTVVGPPLLTRTMVSGNTASHSGGGIRGECTLVDSTVCNNMAAVDGGGILSFGEVTLDHTLVANNAVSNRGGGMFAAIGDCIRGSEFRDNTAQDGAGVFLLQSLSPLPISDTAILDNIASNLGGGLCAAPGSTLDLRRCTVAGNTALQGGGIKNDAATVSSDHSIVAGNSNSGAAISPDCEGTLQSQGYTLLGSSLGATVTGSTTGNQIDVDPLFTNPGSGDYTLQSTSPAREAGDPASRPCLRDAAGRSRIQDGNLDGTMVLDLGAYEFTNLQFDVSGTPTPGGTLTLHYSGTPGMLVFLWAGLAPTQVLFPPFGCFFLDLGGGPFVLLNQGTLPIAPINVPLALDTPTGITLTLQAHAVLSGAGNLSNPVALKLE
jgi:predicted outer membrane repeat protein